MPIHYNSECPINSLLDVISAKWTVEIVRELALQPTRTRKFLLHIPGLSMKTLCRRLQILGEAGLVSRHEFPDKPLKVEYSLTEYGQKLCGILEQIKILDIELNSRNSCLNCKCPIEAEYFAQAELISCPHRRSRKAK